MSEIPLAGRLPLLLALAAVGACATSPPATSPPVASPPATAPVGTAGATPTASVAVVREAGGGGVVYVSFRSETAVAISPGHALRVETPTGTFEAPLGSVPQRAAEGAMNVSSAEYRLSEAGVRALDLAGDRARVSLHDGRAYRSYAVRRSDNVE